MSVYDPSPIKRHRRTKAELEELDRALGEIVAEGGSVSEIAKNTTAVDLATLAERIL